MKVSIKLFGIEFQFHVNKKKTIRKTSLSSFDELDSPKLNFGPGPNWTKPGDDWYSVDVDSDFGDVIVDFQKFEHLPFKDNSIACVYGSHVFEHMSIFKSPLVFSEIYRVLKRMEFSGWYFRMQPKVVKNTWTEILISNFLEEEGRGQK